MVRPMTAGRTGAESSEPVGPPMFGGRLRRVEPQHGSASSRSARLDARSLPGLPEARPPIRSRADGTAVALLHRTAAVLLGELPELTDRLVTSLRAQESAYRAAAVDRDELWQEVHESLENNVRALLRPKETREPARRCSWRIGALRAEQGIPLDALLHAFRLGGGIVWQGLVETATRNDPDDVHLLVHVAADVWNFVDEHCGLVAEAYRQVETRLTRRRHERLRALVGAVLDGAARIADVPAVAAALDLPEHGRYAVVVVTGGERSSYRGSFLPPEVAGARIVWHIGAESDRGIVLLGAERGLEELARSLRVPAGGRAGISPVAGGLAALGSACRLAEIAVTTCTRDGEAALLHDHLPAAMAVSCPDLGAALVERALGPVLALDAPDRELLLSTVTAWLDSDGSALRAGSLLFCHRNTVLNRLRRFEQLTGRSLNRPRDLVELSLALEARRVLP
ncbi:MULTISPECIES: PucR family transcriptional regulator [Actinoalloteichus]|uniref:Regulator of polyketide synthase expression n=1 Tax=Actinoalloteichus fjordicus TaxID=1612552 RepID=A0AAC9PS88_9PSEU|nr:MULTISPECIES: PucR family transcriptional regulator [Actinoalloteichus]APU14765.1 regulator of polyketide synthase expression [Actinoalloteichus fjordicus]APU20736.1 regulator of polyketide synthase expression [Actinoalloteichus sp. GBA129-24]